ncbi:hypothetical protein TWF281_003312 [Arthrobotrys megalospora]
MCDKMGHLCPQFERFGKLFPNHKELQSAICDFYAIVVDFFREALLFLYNSALKQFAISTFRPFEEKFGDILKSLDLAREMIDKEVTLSSEQELHVDRVNNAQLRADVRDLCHFTQLNHQYYQDDRIKLSEEAQRSRRERVLQNISRYPYHSELTNNLHQRIENSGFWIYKTPEYQSWFNSPQSSGLWYHAIPGFGKSVLTAGVVDSLLELSKLSRYKRHCVSYFFCTYTTPSSLLAHTILSSLLHQMLYYSRDLPRSLVEELESRFEDKASTSRVVLTDIQRFLTQIIENNQASNYMVLDGLDECNDKQRGIVLRALIRMLEDVPCNIKILISSRGSQDMVRALQSFQQLDLGTSNQGDIEAFIAQALRDKELEGQLPELSVELLGKINSFLVENAKGLFIWVDLQIEEICKEARPEDIEAVLPTLPKDLDELYDRVIRRIVQLRRPEVAQRIFKWVAYAIRPLTLEELKEAACLEDAQISSWAALRRVAEVDESKWLQNCENLVVVNRANQTVRFAHSTIKDFLMGGKAGKHSFEFDGDDCHYDIAEACVRYLKLPDIIGPNSQHQRTAISKRGLNSLVMAASHTAQNNASWTDWATQRIFKYASSLAPLPSPPTTPSALVRARDSTVVASQRQTFKYMLKTHPFLEYATSSWVFHYASHSQGTQYPQDKSLQIYTLLLQRFHTIRFPWQSHFSPESLTQEEGLFEMLDWALENKVFFVYKLTSDNLLRAVVSSAPSWAVNRSMLTKYWLPIKPTLNGPYGTRFEKYCIEGDFAGAQMWSYLREFLIADISSPSFPRYPGGRLSKQPDCIRYLLGCACERADESLFNELIYILMLLPGASRQSMRDSNILPSKYFRLEDYESMIRKSISANSLAILAALLGDEYLDFIQSLSIDTQFDLLHSVTEVGKADYFRVLLLRYEFGLNGKHPERPSIIQKACEIGEVDIVKMCLRRHSDLRLRSQINRLYPIQIAAKFNHLSVVNAILNFTDDKNIVDVVPPYCRDTALTYAVKNQNVEMVDFLLDKGASFWVSNGQDRQFTLGPTGVEPEELNTPLLQFSITPNVEIAGLFLAKRKREFAEYMGLEPIPGKPGLPPEYPDVDPGALVAEWLMKKEDKRSKGDRKQTSHQERTTPDHLIRGATPRAPIPPRELLILLQGEIPTLEV